MTRYAFQHGKHARGPTAAQASTALTDAEASRARLAEGIATPTWFSTSLAAAIAAQIATTAVGLGDGDPSTLAAGLAIFVAVAGMQLTRFRRLNGVWLGGFASPVVLASATAAGCVHTAPSRPSTDAANQRRG